MAKIACVVLGIVLLAFGAFVSAASEAFPDRKATFMQRMEKAYHFAMWMLFSALKLAWHGLICDPRLGLIESARARMCDRLGSKSFYHEWGAAGFPDEFESDRGFLSTIEAPKDP